MCSSDLAHQESVPVRPGGSAFAADAGLRDHWDERIKMLASRRRPVQADGSHLHSGAGPIRRHRGPPPHQPHRRVPGAAGWSLSVNLFHVQTETANLSNLITCPDGQAQRYPGRLEMALKGSASLVEDDDSSSMRMGRAVNAGAVAASYASAMWVLA